jgi:hypothetical protein
MIDNDSICKTSNRKKKISCHQKLGFFMVTANTDRTKTTSSSQPSNNNIQKQAYTSQLYTYLNLYANEITPMNRCETTNKNGDISNRFRIYHQNIRGLKGKTNERMLHLLTEAHPLICLTEHHLKNFEMDATPIPKYKLGAKYCRMKLKNGGVCIYIQEALKFTNINLQKHCRDQDIEIAALKLKLNKKKIDYTLCIWSPIQRFCLLPKQT